MCFVPENEKSELPLAQLANQGRSFAFLGNDPDLYSLSDTIERCCFNSIGLHCSSKRGVEMVANSVVRARIDEHIKEEAAAILAAAGLTVSDAVRMMLVRVVAEKALPFDPLVPNAETIDAMKAARKGDLVTIGGLDDLMSDLHADD
jgi:DNA-damage-inducible protein J